MGSFHSLSLDVTSISLSFSFPSFPPPCSFPPPSSQSLPACPVSYLTQAGPIGRDSVTIGDQQGYIGKNTARGSTTVTVCHRHATFTGKLLWIGPNESTFFLSLSLSFLLFSPALCPPPFFLSLFSPLLTSLLSSPLSLLSQVVTPHVHEAPEAQTVAARGSTFS